MNLRTRIARALRRFAYRLDPSWGGMVPGRRQASDSPEFAMGDVPRIVGLPFAGDTADALDIAAAMNKRKRDDKGRFIAPTKRRRAPR